MRKQKSEFEEKVLEVARVTRVIAGGKRFSFRATVVVGDRGGRVGLAVAKGLDVASAVTKAKRLAQKNVLRIPRKDKRTVLYDVEGKFSAARVKIKPARPGHGLIAGGSCRSVLELVGIKDVSAKILGRSTNKLNNARATLEALKKFIEVEAAESKPEVQQKQDIYADSRTQNKI